MNEIAQIVELSKQVPDTNAVNWPIVFKLQRPTEIFGTIYSELKLRRPNVADGLKFGLIDGSIAEQNKGAEQTVDLIAQLSGETPQTIKSLPLDEFMRLTNEFWDVFQKAARSRRPSTTS